MHTEPYSVSILTFRPWYRGPYLADVHSSVEHRLVIQEVHGVLLVSNALHNARDPMAKLVDRLNSISHTKRHFSSIYVRIVTRMSQSKQIWRPLHKSRSCHSVESSSSLTLPPCIDHTIYL